MGKLESPQKKKTPQQPVQTKEPEGKTMAPPQFSLESSPVQMKGGLWDSFTGAAEWAGNMLSNAAEALGFGGEDAEKSAPVAKTEEKPKKKPLLQPKPRLRPPPSRRLMQKPAKKMTRA
ncbi:MAG: hypothetical protein IPN95_00415 [Bacteroidetes bacterium]|nr:hypothetical protein [Bacteroidota bacterium]